MLGQLSFEGGLTYLWLPSLERYFTNDVTSVGWYVSDQGLADYDISLEACAELTPSLPLALLNLNKEGQPM